MSSISSVALADSVSDSSEPVDSKPSPSVSLTMTVPSYCNITGHLSRCSGIYDLSIQSLDSQISSLADFRASRTVQPRGEETTQKTSGLNSSESCSSADRVGSLLRMSLESDMTALTGCAVISRKRVTPAGRSIWTLRYRRDNVAGIASSGWPTPTAKANHDSPSMRKWPAYARYQSAVKRTFPRLWEWMMTFPDGWTDCVSLATRSRSMRASSSGAQS